MKNKIKSFINKINNTFFYGKYSNYSYAFENKKIKLHQYILKLLFIYICWFVFLTLIFTNYIYCAVTAAIITIFMINIIILNAKKINYQQYILSQLTIYVNQTSMLINYNNVYTALKETLIYLDYPIKTDLEEVIKKIEDGNTISTAFQKFNEKYNNKTVTLFNQSLELFDLYGNSEASSVLQVISEELNDLKVKKDRFYRFKKEWRLNFYVVIFMCLLMPIILKVTLPDIYGSFMNSFGSIVTFIIMIINLLIINKVEKIYGDLSVGEEGYK